MQSALKMELDEMLKRHLRNALGNELFQKDITANYIRSLYSQWLTKMLPHDQSQNEVQISLQGGNGLQRVSQQRGFADVIDDFQPQPSQCFYGTRKDAKVEFLNLSDVYEKKQRRIDGISKQRIVNGVVHIVVSTHAQLQDIEVYVEKRPEDEIWGSNGEEIKRLALPVTMGAFSVDKQYLSVDLDAVYLGPNGEPFYKLSRVHAGQRNLFRLVLILVFIDGTRSQEFYSKTMRLRSCKNTAAED